MRAAHGFSSALQNIARQTQTFRDSQAARHPWRTDLESVRRLKRLLIKTHMRAEDAWSIRRAVFSPRVGPADDQHAMVLIERHRQRHRGPVLSPHPRFEQRVPGILQDQPRPRYYRYSALVLQRKAATSEGKLQDTQPLRCF